MSTERNKLFVRSYFAALSGKPKPADVLDAFIGSRDADLKQHILELESSFPRYELIEEQMIAEGDKIAIIGRVRGRHDGDFMGAPATGRSFDIPIHITYQIADDKIVAHWLISDSLTMLQQIGLLPAPASR